MNVLARPVDRYCRHMPTSDRPRIRPEIESLERYAPGRPIEEVARELGLTEVIKLASNENPLPPFPEVAAAMAEAVTSVNRYPDSGCYELTRVVADAIDVPADSLWFGAGSSELLTAVSRAVGGEGTSVVFGWPSFAMYPINAVLGRAEAIAVPLDDQHRFDLEALGAAIRPDTSLLMLCNPNNPTGTYRSEAEVRAFIDRVPEDVLIVVDEAYAEYVAAEDYATTIPLALERQNVVVARTFSKIHGLAGLRVGYMIGHPDTMSLLRRSQIPFSVNNIAQIGAITSLGYPDRVAERVKMNREGITYLEDELRARDIEFAPSQANFMWIRFGAGAKHTNQALMERGIIVRGLADEWTRVSIGTDAENRRFIQGLDDVSTEA